MCEPPCGKWMTSLPPPCSTGRQVSFLFFSPQLLKIHPHLYRFTHPHPPCNLRGISVLSINIPVYITRHLLSDSHFNRVVGVWANSIVCRACLCWVCLQDSSSLNSVGKVNVQICFYGSNTGLTGDACEFSVFVRCSGICRCDVSMTDL